MLLLKRLASLRRNLFARPQAERELDEELRAYANQVAGEKRAQGVGAAEAARSTQIEMGGIEQVKEEVRRARSGHMLEQLFQDLRYGARTLRKNSAFTSVAILALALGIGATTAMFSVAYGILFRPLPYPAADRVAVVFMRFYPRDFAFGTMCIRDFLMWRENNHAFEEPSLFRTPRMDIGGSEGVPEQVQGASVTAGFFSTLGVRPLLGRTFIHGEDNPGAPSLTVLSEAIWRRRFGANPAALGRIILVNGAPSTIIGVMPGAFHFPRRETEVWTNLPLVPPTRYGPWFYRGVARLKPGISPERAQAELDAIGQLMMRQNPVYRRLKLPMLSVRDAMLGTTLKPAIAVLVGAVCLVLLIAIVNVANLTLARATVRRREMALRLSLGAERGRLIRQLLTESVLLALAGGAAGLALAWAAIELIHAWNPDNFPFIDSVRLDGRALAFTALVSTLTGVLFGLAPALQSARSDLNSTIQEGGRGGASLARGRTRAVLVVCEVALSLVLLIAAGLLLRSFVNLEHVNGGFQTPPQRILTMLISPGGPKYNDPAAGLAFYDEVLRRARSVPGVEMASATDALPPDRQGDADTFAIEGQPLAPGEINPVISDVTVSPEFFETLGIPLLKGRWFTAHDNGNSKPVVIVSEGFVRRFLPNQNPIGKRIKQSGPGFGDNWMEIVGVAGNVKYLGLTVDTDPAYYMPLAQAYGQRMFLAVRTRGEAAHAAEPLRRAIQSIDPSVTLSQIGAMDQALDLSVAQPRFNTMLLALFAAIALALAAVGIYGLIAYSVAQRTQEIGIRMALGAARADVVRLVVRQGASLAAAGIAIGTAGAFLLTRLLKTLLFGVGVTDILTFAAAALGLMLVALAATTIPALRATRVSPVAALRYE